MLISAGQDSHVDDTLGAMRRDRGRLRPDGRPGRPPWPRRADDRLGFVLEGGYNKVASAHAVEATLRGLADGEAPRRSARRAPHGKVVVAKAVETQRRYWRL